jgi:5-methylcytosine-specific restriction endonuclease McrA
MAKAWAKKFYNSKTWQVCRATYISNRINIDGGICEMCHETPGYIVDHIKELTPENINDPNISLKLSNLQYLCKKCHDKKHGFFCSNEREYFFDANGQIQALPPTKKP